MIPLAVKLKLGAQFLLIGFVLGAATGAGAYSQFKPMDKPPPKQTMYPRHKWGTGKSPIEEELVAPIMPYAAD